MPRSPWARSFSGMHRSDRFRVEPDKPDAHDRVGIGIPTSYYADDARWFEGGFVAGISS